ncbi:hypothetical protein MBM_07242 [Drepanopeziza brunnea f. sp. 'multigermtubi' MB_m1]|uniref:Uncharacterized protein n=1 Tax=Marssonina brunnea f. sp. multigermtubi (strain MB_m1) TaxID=1072389 RepID=K1WNJ1_MARBU|nr:uncharacterized protein MBM_07242 [Drepanopeziza brunnea f. sp. 'multigermtubi' MB_m1]EKD14521.1 hypothetical protein MBM_07242 [Drepanopeziza brunnea f. sp. 'multigermtubi' MB_m1]
MASLEITTLARETDRTKLKGTFATNRFKRFYRRNQTLFPFDKDDEEEEEENSSSLNDSDLSEYEPFDDGKTMLKVATSDFNNKLDKNNTEWKDEIAILDEGLLKKLRLEVLSYGLLILAFDNIKGEYDEPKERIEFADENQTWSFVLQKEPESGTLLVNYSLRVKDNSAIEARLSQSLALNTLLLRSLIARLSLSLALS